MTRQSADHHRISKKLVERAQLRTRWDAGNDFLYSLCREFPEHDDPEGVVAKVWLIGRAYSAAIDRGRGGSRFGSLSNEVFYTEKVPEILGDFELDRKLGALRKWKSLDAGNVERVLELHWYLVEKLEVLTARRKRSLASKYLHFHLPELFFIYDSRAAAAMSSLERVAVSGVSNWDPQYSAFVEGATRLRERVKRQHGVELTPRQIDRLLLLVPTRER